MWIIIVLVIIGFIIYRFVVKTNETVGSVQKYGGMRAKYSKLLNHILEGHKDSRIMLETRTYISAGVSNCGGSTIFHIQQCPNHTVMIDYEVSDNPVIGAFSMRFTFPDDMDQDKMMREIALGIQRKMMGF